MPPNDYTLGDCSGCFRGLPRVQPRRMRMESNHALSYPLICATYNTLPSPLNCYRVISITELWRIFDYVGILWTQRKLVVVWDAIRGRVLELPYLLRGSVELLDGDPQLILKVTHLAPMLVLSLKVCQC
jgi:hypothetical protein